MELHSYEHRGRDMTIQKIHWEYGDIGFVNEQIPDGAYHGNGKDRDERGIDASD